MDTREMIENVQLQVKKSLAATSPLQHFTHQDFEQIGEHVYSKLLRRLRVDANDSGWDSERNQTFMAIEKLTIKNLDNQDSFPVLFNPTEYTFEDASKWQEHATSGWKPELQYTGGDRRRLSMELFYDTYESNQDVRLYTGKLAELLVVSTNDQNDGSDRRNSSSAGARQKATPASIRVRARITEAAVHDVHRSGHAGASQVQCLFQRIHSAERRATT